MKWLALLVLLALPLLPVWSLDCKAPAWQSSAPDGSRLVACGRPRFFAMPGDGGDGPAWLVLRDTAGFIRHVVSLSLVADIGQSGASWGAQRVVVPLYADLPRPTQLASPQAWLVEQSWRLRAFFRLVPADTSFR